MRIAFVAANSHFDVRFRKIAATAVTQGHEVVFVGVDRDPQVRLPDPPEGVVLRLLARPIPTRRALLRAVPALARHIARQLRLIQPDVVYCRDEEAVIFALTARLLGCGVRPIICDLYDSLALRMPGAVPRLLARAITAVALARSHQIIVTDDNRRRLLPARHLPRVTVLPNYPRRADVARTGTLPSGPVRILVAGQLLRQRGLDRLLDACLGLQGVELWCAGQAMSSWTREVFLRSPLVRYFGVLSQPRVLELSEACDAVFSFYEPLTPNDINASPNKLYDAMMVGRPVIINAETRIARFVTTHGLGYVVGYYDTEGLRTVLQGLVGARPSLPEFARRTVAVSQAQYSWEAFEARLIDVLEAAGRHHIVPPATDSESAKPHDLLTSISPSKSCSPR
ncbi:MAG TPA: glycosyltransferase family 4 protein [Gemmatimonadales bacterium]